MSFFDKIRNWSAAVAFAEVAEFDTATQISGMKSLPQTERVPLAERLQNLAVAAAFAEEGLYKEASALVNPKPVRASVKERPSFFEIVGLQNAPVRLLVTNG